MLLHFLDEYDQLNFDLLKTATGISAGSNLFAGISTFLGFEGEDGLRARKGLSAFTSVLSSFMGSLGPIVDMFKYYFSSSQQSQQMKQLIELLDEGFNEMRGRFDDIDNQIGDLEKRMEELDFWGSVKNQLDEITHIDGYIKTYFSSLSKAIRDQAVADMIKYDLLDDLKRAINALKNEFTGLHDGYSVCRDLTSFTGADRRLVNQVSIKIYNEMVKGARNAILMSQILDRAGIDKLEAEYVTMLTDIGKSIDDCDSEIKSKEWLTQWHDDLKKQLDDYSFPGAHFLHYSGR